MEERRRSRRMRTYLGGQVAFNQQCSILTCLVRNVSSEGAKLVFPKPVTIPSQFDLTIFQKGDSQSARIIWLAQDEAGVILRKAESAKIVSIEHARRIKTLEAERDSLVKRIAQLSEPK